MTAEIDEYHRIINSLPRCEISIEDRDDLLHDGKKTYGPYQCGRPSLVPCEKCGINVCYYHSTWEIICQNCNIQELEKKKENLK